MTYDLLAADAQSVTFTAFDPFVIPSTRTDPVLYEATISGRPTRVTLEFSPGPVLSSAPEVEMRDEGGNGDRRAADGVYSVTLPATDIIRALRTDDVQRVFVGFLNLFNGSQRVFRGNVFVDVYTGDVGTTSITRLSADMQATSRLLDINDPAFFLDFSITRITQQFYRVFGDDYDFLNIISMPGRFLNRDHGVVKNDVEGIGLPRQENSARYGSAGRLRGYSRFPVPTFFDGATTGYIHELGHQWIDHLDFQPFDSGVPHWPLSSMDGGIMGWSTRAGEGLNFSCDVVLDAGTVRLLPRPGEPVFSDLDLYLMGIIGPDEVREQVVFVDQAAAQRLNCTGQAFTGAVYRVNARTVIDRVGPRRPDARESSKRFRTATILVSRDGLVSSEAMWLYSWLAARADLQQPALIHEGFRKGTGNPFFVAARGRATLGTIIGLGAPDFEVAAVPASIVVAAGSTATARITATPTRTSFDAPVNLACAQLPDQVSCTFSPPQAVPGGTWAEVILTVGTGGSETEPSTTPPGTYSIVITGTAGALVHDTIASLTVQ